MDLLYLSTVLFLWALVPSPGHAILSRKCGKCEEERCPLLTFCTGEVVRDHCGCCSICSSDLYQPHVRLTPLPQKGNACEKVKCPKYKVCMINMQGLPLCVCPNIYMCRRRKKREVCGSDGKTYQSRCHMRIAACTRDKRIRKKFRGPCEKKDSFEMESSPKLKRVNKEKKKKRRRMKKKKRRSRRRKRRHRRRRVRLSKELF